MSEPFSLDELIPEKLTARLAGQVYDVRMIVHLGPAEYAQFSRLQERVTQALTKLHKGTADEQVIAGGDIGDTTDQLIAILIPDLAPATIKAMTFGKKSAFIDYWRGKQPVASPKAKPDKPVTRGRRLSGSSSRATTPSVS